MLDLSKQQAFEQKVEKALEVQTPKGSWNLAALYKDFMRGGHVKQIAKLMEQVGKVDTDLLGLTGDLDNSLKAIKGVRLAQAELQGLVGDLKHDVDSAATKVRTCTAELRKVLGIRRHTFSGMSIEEKKQKLAEVLNSLDKDDTKKVKNICKRISGALEQSKEALCDAYAVVNIAENFGQKLKSERESRGLDLSEPAVATAFTTALTSALTGFTAATAALRASGKRQEQLEDGVTKAAQKAITDFTSSLDSEVALVKAGPLLSQVTDLSAELTAGARVTPSRLEDGRIVVAIPSPVKAKLLARLDAEIPATLRTDMQTAVNTLASAGATAAEKQTAAELLKNNYAGVHQKLQQMKKLVDDVSIEYSHVMDSELKISTTTASGRVTHKLVPNVLAQKPLKMFAEKLINQVKGEMIADSASAAEIATETGTITTKFIAIKTALKTAMDTKLESLLGDTAVSLTDLGDKCKQAVKAALDLLEVANIKSRFPADQDQVARGQALNDLESALQTALR